MGIHLFEEYILQTFLESYGLCYFSGKNDFILIKMNEMFKNYHNVLLDNKDICFLE